MTNDIMKVRTASGGYEVISRRGASDLAPEIWGLSSRKTLIVTDSGVPRRYSEKIAEKCGANILTLPQGEATKSEHSLSVIWEKCCEYGLTRSDCIVAVGGGVVGDLAGFAAATYMRGIDFFNIPTTVLSQVDSSVGGKTAIDFGGYKNIVGAFHQPKGVILDEELLRTLPGRHVSNGLAEAVKMAATFDEELFSFIEENDPAENLGKVIREAVKIKIKVVEEDEREAGLRRVLNFGHTAAHAIESAHGFEDVLHGEAVAMGMIPMADGEARGRIKGVLEKLSLPAKIPVAAEKLTEAVYHDKKMYGGKLICIVCPKIGRYELAELSPEEFERRVAEGTV